MSEQHREILNRHWQMLKTYINPTDCLIDTLVKEKVLPASMAEDIRAGDCQISKNDRLLKSLKIVGSVAFKKFRHILLDHGHAFISELLWAEDKDCSPFIEECDFNNFPSFKTSMNPMELKQLIWLLDSKVKTRILQSEWRNNSEERIKKLKEKIHHDVFNTDDLKTMIVKLNSELSSKNEMLKNMVKDYNILNDDVTKFEKRHSMSTKMTIAKSTGCGDGKSSNQESSLGTVEATPVKESRFKYIDSLICDMDQRLSTLLGDEEAKQWSSVEDLNGKTKRLKQLVRELEIKVDRHTEEEKKVKNMLFPEDTEEHSHTLVQNIQKFLAEEQGKRVALLKDVDSLSKKLRGITEEDSHSALKGLRQSAVTGDPSPEIVDFRFLRNHLALLLAEADHMTKKIMWKDEELNSLRTEFDNNKFRVTKPSSSKRVLKPIEFPRR